MLPLVLSSDSHLFEPPDLWQTRIDAAFRDRAPRIERIDGADLASGIRKLAADPMVARAASTTLPTYTSILRPNWGLRTRCWSAPISAAGSRPR